MNPLLLQLLSSMQGSAMAQPQQDQTVELDFSQPQQEPAQPSQKTLEFYRQVFKPQTLDSVGLIKNKLQQSGITDPKEIAQFLATSEAESSFKFTPENLAGYKNTSTERIRKVFKNKVKDLSDEQINALKQEPEKLFDIIYKDLGGSKYRGRGPLQLTGIENYRAVSKNLFGDDRLVQNPELVEDPEIGINASIEFWKLNNLGEIGRQKGFDEVQRIINVGPKGKISQVQELKKRRNFYNKFLLEKK